MTAADTVSVSDGGRAPFWKVWAILTAAGVLGVLAILPYSLAAQAGALEQIAHEAPIPLSAILAIQLVQNAVFVAIAVAAGLWAARRLDLATPIVDALAAGRAVPWKPRAAAISAAVGVAAALLLLGLDVYVFGGLDGIDPAAPAARPPVWTGFLASFYGGITEELFLRLFLLSLIALGLHAAATAGRPGSRPLSGWAFWTANLAAAVIFGLGHLPATAMLVPLTGEVILRAVVLNGIVGVACGVLYRRFGLEWAILAHFSADIVLHVLFPLISP